MTDFHITPIATETVRALRDGGKDAHGQVPERAISNGQGNPCRHCLQFIPEGAEMLILAHRPFDAPQPYAEVGPIFFCADDCAPWTGAGFPPVLGVGGDDRLIKGYDADDRIVYGLGRISTPDGMEEAIGDVLADPRVAYAHVRSSTNNCYTCRADRDA